ncbi:MAG: hypothetical protein AB1630_12620 [bacterium]
MKKILASGLMGIILLFFLDFAFCEVSVEEIKKMGVEEILGLLNHPNWGERAKAIYYGVPNFINDERIKLALINLLEEENALGEKWWEEWQKEYERCRGDETKMKIKFMNEVYGEGYGEYHIDLADTVIRLKDERAIQGIVGVVECGGVPVRAVVEFGELAVNPLLERLEKTKNYTARSSIIYTLNEIAKRTKQETLTTKEGTPTTRYRSATPSQLELMRAAFVKSLNDSNPFSRRESIRGLDILEDTSAIHLLKQIAKNDPYCKLGTVDPVTKAPRKGYYPVRDEAKRVLKLLKEKKKQEKKKKEVKQ